MGKQMNSNPIGLIHRLSLWVVMMFIGSMAAWSQVTGTVVDENDEPLPGVTVLIKGSETGVSTDINGHYSINAGENSTLIFRYIGMKNQGTDIKESGKITSK